MPADTYTEILGDLRSLYMGLPGLRLKETHRRITYIAHGWYMRVNRNTEAVLLLREHGYAMEAWPVRRSLLEHVVALKWLAAEGNLAADLVRRKHATTASGRKRAAVDAEWSSADLAIFDEVIADLDATDEYRSYDNLFGFAKRCKTYGSPDDMAAYLIDTDHSHPGWETASPYLGRSEAGEVSMLAIPRFDGSRDDAGFCAMQMWKALAAINGMLETPVWDDALERTQERIARIIEAR